MSVAGSEGGSASAAGTSLSNLNIQESKISKAVPKIRRTNDATEDGINISQSRRDSFVEVINILDFNRELAPDAANNLKKRLKAKQDKERFGEVGNEAPTLGSYSEVWQGEYISEKLQVPSERVGKAKAKDPQFYKHCFTALLNPGCGLQLLPECRNPAVMHSSCDERHDQAGHRGGLLMCPIPLIDSEGKVNWEAGIYLMADATAAALPARARTQKQRHFVGELGSGPQTSSSFPSPGSP